MKRFNYFLLMMTAVLLISGCSTRYVGTGLNDFHRSSELLAESLTGIFSEVIDEDMELRAQRSVDKSVISVKDLEPVIVSYQNLRTRQELANSCVKYSLLLKSFFEKDHTASVREYGEDLKATLNSIRSYDPGLVPETAGGIISTIITMAPEGYTFLRKKKFAVRLMGEMQKVIEKVFEKLRNEITSLKLLAPNLYTRLFREKVVKRWPDKKDKRVKFAVTGVKIIRRREKFIELSDDLLKVLEMMPVEHKKLMLRFGKKGGNLTGLTDLLNFSLRLKNNYDLLSKGEK
ncbi:MAG: hypothetical protein ABFR36_03470 [Acidobacteriota bacterium]